MEWPALTTTPRPRSAATTSSAPGSSGARVVSHTWLSRDHAATSASAGVRRCTGLCAPFFLGLRKGPSQCSPSGTLPCQPEGAPAASVSCALATCASGEVMIVGRKLVTPQRGRPAATCQMVSGSSVKSAPNAPFNCTSMKPGATINPPASMTAAPAGTATVVASPTATMRPRSINNTPSSIWVSGVSNVARWIHSIIHLFGFEPLPQSHKDTKGHEEK